MDRQIDIKIDGQKDRYLNRQIDRQIININKKTWYKSNTKVIVFQF